MSSGGTELDLNANVKISSFAVGSIAGNINDTTRTINIQFPFGYDRSAVAPTLQVSAGATVNPTSGTTVNLKNTVKYRVYNGNIFGDYIVNPTEEKAVLSFVIHGQQAIIDENERTIKASVPIAIDITSLMPTITLATGATITPATGITQDFTNPVTYTVTKGGVTIPYTVTVSKSQPVGFLGTAATANDITNADEKAAWQWLSASNPEAEYVSFSSISSQSATLSKYKVIWWHEDVAQALPTAALDATVTAQLQTYYNNGGSFLFTGYGASYVSKLGIVPSGKGPNNSFGDNLAWLEANWAWGISFKGHESHPAFKGLTLTTDKPYATAYLLAAQTYRLNHTAQWYIPDWGGYGTPANWRSQTGGIDLGSAEWDENHTSQVSMAEFPKTATHGATIVIGSGCYDWYTEANPSNSSEQPANSYLPNTKKMTENILEYLGQ